tara:strand:- start:717 stop:1148 length:432 start_codon:yes stop_codon:yes gene_type:complete
MANNLARTRDRLFGDLFTDWNDNFDLMFRPVGQTIFNTAPQGMTLPHTNVLNNKDNWTIEVAAPGLDKKDFKIAIDKDVLTVSYNVKKESNNSFISNSFQRSWNLPEGTKFEDVKASYKSGILGLTVKKPDIIKQETKYINIT